MSKSFSKALNGRWVRIVFGVLVLLVLVLVSDVSLLDQKYLLQNNQESVQAKRAKNETLLVVATNRNPTTPTAKQGQNTSASNNRDTFQEPNKDETHSQTTIDNIPTTQHNHSISIIVQLSGEMGNQLSKIAYGKAVQWRALEYNITNTQLILRAQEHGKWKHAMVDTTACFPNMRPYDFRAANTQEFTTIHQEQSDWLGKKASLLDVDCMDQDCIDESLNYLKSVLDGLDSGTLNTPPTNVTRRNVSIPHLYTLQFSNKAFVTMDQYHDELRDLFAFDYKACCNVVPDADESVFHFRNFRGEMPRRWKNLGFVEASPNKTAFEVFGHLQPGEKVAITTRIAGPIVQEYVTALRDRGLLVRLVEGQSGIQDFCFLLSTQKELVGMAMSTFVTWAGYLGNAKKVRLYSMNTPRRREIHPNGSHFIQYNWTRSKTLKSKMLFEVYKSEDQELWETQMMQNNLKNQVDFDCGCPASCKDASLREIRNGLPFSCRERIDFMMQRYKHSQIEACVNVATQDACGPECNPETCSDS